MFPGVRDCLDGLAQHGVAMAVVSSRGRYSLVPLLEQLQIHGHFREVLSEEDVPGKKPAPDLVLELGVRLGVAPARILVVGDTTYDIEMGRAAGAETCAVTYGNHDLPLLESARPTHVLDSLSALGALFAA